MMIRNTILSILALFISIPHICYSQAATIQLFNPSFEDYPRAERVPRGWTDCGFPGESAPDTHPSGAFDVIKGPSHGNTYLGMVVRDNDTWERVSQQLISPIRGGQCYNFELNLCRSELYVSQSRVSGTRANYVNPVKLIIWGGDNYCSKQERLAESPLISNTEWQRYSFKFEPKRNHNFIVLEAFYQTPVLFPYNGNVLIDHASEILPIPCNETPELAKIPEVEFTNPNNQFLNIKDSPRFTVQARIKHVTDKSAISFLVNGKDYPNFNFDAKTGLFTAEITRFINGRNSLSIQATNSRGTHQDQATLAYERPKEVIAATQPREQEEPISYEAPDPPKEVITTSPQPKVRKIEGYSRAEIKTGQIIKISALSFKMNDSTLNTSAHVRLDDIYEFLKENDEIVIEIGGHTSGLCEEVFCNQLSTARAKAVADYLKDKGVPQRQLSYKGYGKNQPIASNNTPGGRRRNQRVEIKILSTDG